jgi:hypothetical protein
MVKSPVCEIPAEILAVPVERPAIGQKYRDFGVRWHKTRAGPPPRAERLADIGIRMKGLVHARDAMFVECKGRQAKGGHANKSFGPFYSFISVDFGVEPARCGLHRARLDLFVRCAAKRRCDQTIATTALAAA